MRSIILLLSTLFITHATPADSTPAVTTGEYGYLSGVAFTPAGELALFRDAGQDTQYTLTLGFGLDDAWQWLRGRD